MAEVVYQPGDSDERPWGRWEVLAVGSGYAVKRITVKPGGILSLQKHRFRAEHWFIAKGNATVTLGERIFEVPAGGAVDIALGEVHRVANHGTLPVEMIEVQHGEKLDENDIIRLEDSYGRS